jgi:ATP-dependent DNA helicase RecQ
VLVGKSTEKVVRFGHEKQPVFGAGKDLDAKEWQSVFRQITASGLVVVDHEAHGALTLGETARAVFRGERKVVLRKDRPQKAAEVRRSLRKAVDLPAAAAPVFDALRAERSRIARQQGVPPYVVFQDATLRAMALARPSSLDQLIDLPGIGQAKLERYGAAFLAVLTEQR